MQALFLRGIVLSLLVFALQLTTRGVEQAPLRYKFKEGTTNAYRVTIESPNENNRLRFEGVVLVGVRSVEENVATIFFRSRFQQKNERPEGQPPNFGMMPNFGPHGPFGQANPLQQMFRFQNMPQFSEVSVDTQGQLQRVAGLPDLPRPLENYAALFLQPLPTHGQDLKSESVVMVDEDFGGRGRMPGGFHPGMPGGGVARLAGLRKESITFLSPTNGQTRLARNVEFQSFAKTDDEPRLSTKSKSEILFDADAGMVKSMKVEGNSIVSTLDMLQKSSLILRAEVLEGEELAKAIGEAADRTPKVNESDLESLLTDLQGQEPQKRMEAVQRLMVIDLDKYAERLLPIVQPFLNDNDQNLRMLAARVLAKSAAREHLPILHRMLKQEDFGQQHETIQALGRIKDKSSIQPLADMIAYGSGNAYAAAEALGEFGPIVEEAALGLLKEKHLETRRQACQILRKAGTSKSIEALQAVIAAGDPQLIGEATEAVRGIRQRGDEAAKLVF